jgi:uncharacterized protein YcfL
MHKTILLASLTTLLTVTGCSSPEPVQDGVDQQRQHERAMDELDRRRDQALDDMDERLQRDD